MTWETENMTSTSSSCLDGAPAAVIEDSPPHQPAPPPATAQLQPHSQLLSTSLLRVDGASSPSSTADSISPGAHNPGPEQARQDEGNNTPGRNSPSAPPTTTTTNPNIKIQPTVQLAEINLNTAPLLPNQKTQDVPKTPATPVSTPNHRRKSPTTRLNTHQTFYIFMLDGLGAMILSGAINFAIAYAMYTTGSVPPQPIFLFHLPNSLAGDAAVTIILQTVITWLVEFLLVNRDLERGGVRPVGFVQIPRSGTGKGVWVWRFVRWFCFLHSGKERDGDPTGRKGGNSTKEVMNGKVKNEGDLEGGVNETTVENQSWVSFIWSQIVRALVVAVAMFLLLWGPCVGILMALGRKDESIGARGDWVFERRVWLPQGFKLILGGLLALLETPAFAFFWMVQAGWAFQRDRSTGAGAATGVKGERKSVAEEEV